MYIQKVSSNNSRIHSFHEAFKIMLGHKYKCNKFKTIEIMLSIFSAYMYIKLEIDERQSHGKFQNIP
jgi:hypothetical protein